jgi:hypothetical protein
MNPSQIALFTPHAPRVHANLHTYLLFTLFTLLQLTLFTLHTLHKPLLLTFPNLSPLTFTLHFSRSFFLLHLHKLFTNLKSSHSEHTPHRPHRPQNNSPSESHSHRHKRPKIIPGLAPEAIVLSAPPLIEKNICRRMERIRSTTLPNRSVLCQTTILRLRTLSFSRR